MTIGYYPGCSLHGTGREYDESVRAVAGALGLTLREIDDWSCCGATSAHSVNPLLAVVLPARNLALAESAGMTDVLTPCAACYNRLARSEHAVATNPELAEKMPRLLGRPFSNSVHVRTVLDVLRESLPVIKEKTVQPLKGMKVACYYGCLLLRPAEIAGGDDPESPTFMEEIVKAIGAEPVTWNLRMDCCGARCRYRTQSRRPPQSGYSGRCPFRGRRSSGGRLPDVPLESGFPSAGVHEQGRNDTAGAVSYGTARSGIGPQRGVAGPETALRQPGAHAGTNGCCGKGGGVMARIGVFVCHCGENIGRTVDVPSVARAAQGFPGVVVSKDNKYTCSEPGQAIIREAIREHMLTGVVIAACSPHMHERTFRRVCASAGLNPFLCEIANIREHCSWIHEDRGEATAKAIDLVRLAVEKVKRNIPLETISIPIERKALVIGGGIAGIQAALDIADGGREVILVEKEPSIGGHMSQLSETFPTLDCSQCILTPRMVEVAQHPRIRLMTYSEVESVDGYVGNFEVTIRKKARKVDVPSARDAARV